MDHSVVATVVVAGVAAGGSLAVFGRSLVERLVDELAGWWVNVTCPPSSAE